MRPRTLWIPALLSSLALLLVVGGIAVGHYYWTSLRGSMGRMANSMSVARQRQQDLLEQISETQGLFAIQQARLQQEAETLRRQEEALAAARRQFALERLSTISVQTECEQQPAGPTTEKLRLTEAARLIETAEQRLSTEKNPDAARETLSAATALLERIDGAHGAELRERIWTAREQIAAVTAADRNMLTERLDAVRTDASRLRPNRDTPAPGRGNSIETSNNLISQLDAARFALDRGDADLFRNALATAEIWLKTFFDLQQDRTLEVARAIGDLKTQPLVLDFSAASAELKDLSAALRAAADGGASSVAINEDGESAGEPKAPFPASSM